MSTTQSINFKWPQGEDLNIQLIYREGDSPSKAVPVPLNSGYALRMDLVKVTGSSRTLVTTLEFGEDDPATADEVTLGSGANKQPNINIFLDRTLVLPGGAVYAAMTGGTSTFAYDIFIRNTATNRQVKILKGNISVEGSYTLWD